MIVDDLVASKMNLVRVAGEDLIQFYRDASGWTVPEGMDILINRLSDSCMELAFAETEAVEQDMEESISASIEAEFEWWSADVDSDS
jgi:hypothetical protein